MTHKLVIDSGKFIDILDATVEGGFLSKSIDTRVQILDRLKIQYFSFGPGPTLDSAWISELEFDNEEDMMYFQLKYV